MAELAGKKIAVLVEDGFEDLELWYPVLRLREAGAEVDVIGTGSAGIQRWHGLSFRREYRCHGGAWVNSPGGWAPNPAPLGKYWFYSRHFPGWQPVGAICRLVDLGQSADRQDVTSAVR